MTECIICKDTVLIPVEVTCFECFSKDKVSCSTFSRVCRKCAHDYLELDKSVVQRRLYTRCFYCPAVVRLFNLSSHNAYRKDFLLVQNDVSQNHVCPYCHIFQGNQIMIDTHLDTECPAFVVQCSCGRCLERQDLSFHYPFCLQHAQCQECQDYIVVDNFESHMSEHHDMRRCTLCRKFVLVQDVLTHLTQECPHRIISCDYCQASLEFRHMTTHLDDHVKNFETTFQQLTQRISHILDDYRRFIRFRVAFLRTT